MKIQIDCEDTEQLAGLRRLAQFHLARVASEVIELRVRIRRGDDGHGRALTDCRLTARLRDGASFTVTEVQADFEVANRRALQRCLRICQRRARRRLGEAA